MKLPKIVKYSSVILFALVIGTLNAQQQDMFRLKPKLSGEVYQKLNRNRGTEFLFNQWLPGSVELYNGLLIDDLRLNYNGISQDLIYAIDNNIPVVVASNLVKSFTVLENGEVRKFVISTETILAEMYEKPVYLEVLLDGKNKVYANRIVKINKVLAQNNPFNESVYFKEVKYYANVKNNLIKAVHSKRSYFEYYNKSTVNQLIRSKQLMLKSEIDLVKFISLLEKEQDVSLTLKKN